MKDESDEMIGIAKRKDPLSLLSRFVADKEGNRIGESISLYNDLLIIKKDGDYYAIPLKHVELKNEEIHLKGIVQWEKAKELAEEWKKMHKMAIIVNDIPMSAGKMAAQVAHAAVECTLKTQKESLPA